MPVIINVISVSLGPGPGNGLLVGMGVDGSGQLGTLGYVTVGMLVETIALWISTKRQLRPLDL